MRIVSREPTALAYDGRLPSDRDDPRHVNPVTRAGIPRYAKDGWRIVIYPGVNTVSDDDMDILSRDANFLRHEEAGLMTVLQDERPAPVEEPAAPAGDDSNAKFVKDWEGLSVADKSAMYPSLSDEEKALVKAP